MADLITTIKVNSNQFDNSIKESTNQIRKFDAQAKKSSGSVSGFDSKISSAAIGGIAKFAGALGAAFTSMEVFNGVIQSTQATSDAFDIKMQQLKSSVDHFFSTIATGDWSNFWDGLDGAIRRGKELAMQLDELGDVLAGYSVTEIDLRNKLQDSINIIQDPNSSKAQIDEAIKIAEETQKELSRITNERVIPQVQEAIRASFSEAAKTDDITDEDITAYWKIQLKDDEGYKEYKEERERLEKLSDETIEVDLPRGGVARSRTAASYEAEKQLEAYKKQNAQLERMYQIENNIVDTKKDNIKNLVIQGKHIERNELQSERMLNRAKKAAATRGKGGTNEEIIPEGSLKDIKNQINNLNKQIELELNPAKRAELYEQIQELEKKVIVIEVSYKMEDVGTVAQEWISGRVTPEEVLNNAANFKIKIPELPELTKTDPFETYKNALQSAREENEGALESFNAISNALSAIGSASDEGAAAWFSYGASVLSAVGQAIPSIAALISTKKAETQANIEAAATGAASAVASIPIVGPILAVASIASVLAAMFAIPKFADGGLVYGNTIAQVGEYAGASNNPEVIAPLSKLRDILADTNSGIGSGTVDFKIAGKDLVGVINNYSHKNNKK